LRQCWPAQLNRWPSLQLGGRSDSTGTYTPITDALGSVLALANSSGTIVTQYGYTPFGGTSSTGATNTNSSQYTGRENDGNGLYYYRARYYSPSLHRFVSQDPRGFAGGGTNLYAYAGNTPTNLRDPSGQSPCVVGAAAGVIIYNGYQIWREVSAFMNGRKVPNAGWSGAWNIISGSAQAAGAGCAIADGATGLAGAGEGAAGAGAGGLPAEIANTFEDGQYSAKVLEEDTTYYRAETDSLPDGPGRWFGTEAPGTQAEADSMYNISEASPKYEMNAVNSYSAPAGTTVYEGPVAGGTGTQVYIPNPGASGVTQIGSAPLPVYIPR
jgi:RHS repeat-associated protein